MLSCDFAILDLAAARPAYFLTKACRIFRDSRRTTLPRIPGRSAPAAAVSRDQDRKPPRAPVRPHRLDGLRTRFDSIILAQQTAQALLHGLRAPEASRPTAPEPLALQRPEYTGGIGVQGLAHLEQFVRGGGTLITLDTASEAALAFFPVPARSLLKPPSASPEVESGEGWYCPGSILRMAVDNTRPIAFGMPREAYAMSTGGHAFEMTLLPEFHTGDRAITSVARYAGHNVLASGWLSGEQAVAGKDILLEAKLGKGRVVLFGFRPPFRGQSHGTFKLLLNAIYLGSADRL